MSYRLAALTEAKKLVGAYELDAGELGRLYKEDGQPLTPREFRMFRAAWGTVKARLDRLLDNAMTRAKWVAEEAERNRDEVERRQRDYMDRKSAARAAYLADKAIDPTIKAKRKSKRRGENSAGV